MSADVATVVPEFSGSRSRGRIADPVPLTLSSPTLASDLAPEQLAPAVHHDLPSHRRSGRWIFAALLLMTVGGAAVALVTVALTRF